MMRKILILNLCWNLLMIGLQLNATNSGSMNTPIYIGTQRELFVDYHLVKELKRAELKLQEPRSGGGAIKYDGMADHHFSGYTTVFKDDNQYRMYYRGYDPGMDQRGEDLSKTLTCYAESMDGINWTKPNLGIVEINGSKDNNVVIPLGEAFIPFFDNRPDVPVHERYKANMEQGSKRLIAFNPETSELYLKKNEKKNEGMVGLVSPDGIHWKPVSDEPIMPKDPDLENHMDAASVIFWSETEQSYITYQRYGVGGKIRGRSNPDAKGLRSMVRATSKDFRTWTKPVPMTFSDTGSEIPEQHVYVNNTQPYFRAPHIYISLAARFQSGKRVLTDDQAALVNAHPGGGGEDDVADGILMTSRAGSTQYDCIFKESFVRPGIGYGNWTSRTNYPAIGIVQTGPAEMSFFVQRKYGQESAFLERMTLRLDGFTSVSAPFEGGEMITRSLNFSGTELEINYSTSAAGEIAVEIQDAAGKPFEGFSLEECDMIIGDEISRIVKWDGVSDLTSLAGKSIRLRFRMKDADLFSLRFRP